MDRRLLALDSKNIERILRRYGFLLDRSKGSHQQFVGFVRGKKRRVTVVTRQDRFTVKTLASMIRQSGLSEQEWVDML